MGRHRKPPELHVIDGTYRDHRHAGECVAAGEPSIPKGVKLDHVALNHWRQVIEGSLRGIVGASDSHAAVALCQAWSQYQQQFAASMADPGDPGVFRRSQMAFASWCGLASRFGLTPVDRAKVRPVAANGDQEAERARRMFGS